MKSPPKQIADDEAHAHVERFIKQYARTPAKGRPRKRKCGSGARLFWIGAAVLLGVAALVAVVAVLRGDFTETDGKILATLGTTLAAGGAALAGLALVERRDLAPLGWLVACHLARRVRRARRRDRSRLRRRAARPQRLSRARSAAARLDGTLLGTRRTDWVFWVGAALVTASTASTLAGSGASLENEDWAKVLATGWILVGLRLVPRPCARPSRRPEPGGASYRRRAGSPRGRARGRRAADRPPAGSSGMADPTLAPASSLALESPAGVFTAGYQDYHTSVQVDAAALGFMTRAWDLDLDASRGRFAAASRWGCACSACAATRRGSAASGRGLRAPGDRGTARGGGAGRGARTSVREVRLEVIGENERAIPLYERLGFERTRGLELWLLAGAARSTRPPSISRTHGVRELRRSRAGSATTAPWRTSTT